MKILLRATFSQYSGYGRDGIGLAEGLLARGHQVFLSPAHLDAPVPPSVAALLTHPLDGIFDLALHHMEPEKAFLPLEDQLRSRRNVLWTMWGWDNLPDEPWVSQFADETELFDQIVCYDPATLRTFADLIPDEKRLVQQVGGYAADDWKPQPTVSPTTRPYVFGMNGRLTLRKGVYTAYSAFCELKERWGDQFDAKLVLRTTEPVFPPEADLPPGVEVVPSRALPGDLSTFYANIHTLVCPSWADAKNLPPIEALACGTPVIISDQPGHRTWATSDMVTFIPTTVKTLVPGFRGWHASVEDTAEAMWQHYLHPHDQLRKAAVAQRLLPASMDWAKCLERLGHQIGLPL